MCTKLSICISTATTFRNTDAMELYVLHATLSHIKFIIWLDNKDQGQKEGDDKC